MLVISIRSTCGTTGAEVCKTSDISIGIWGYFVTPSDMLG